MAMESLPVFTCIKYSLCGQNRLDFRVATHTTRYSVILGQVNSFFSTSEIGASAQCKYRNELVDPIFVLYTYLPGHENIPTGVAR